MVAAGINLARAGLLSATPLPAPAANDTGTMKLCAMPRSPSPPAMDTWTGIAPGMLQIVDEVEDAVAVLITRGLLLGTDVVIIFLVRMDLATGASILSVESTDLTDRAMICG